MPPAGTAPEGNGHRGGGVLASPNDVLAGSGLRTPRIRTAPYATSRRRSDEVSQPRLAVSSSLGAIGDKGVRAFAEGGAQGIAKQPVSDNAILMVGDQVAADTPVPRSRLLTRGHRRLMGQDLPHHAPPTRPDADYEPARVRFCR